MDRLVNVDRVVIGSDHTGVALKRALVDYLLARCRLGPDAVKTHQQINPIYTRCPGRYFPTKSFLKELKEENTSESQPRTGPAP